MKTILCVLALVTIAVAGASFISPQPRELNEGEKLAAARKKLPEAVQRDIASQERLDDEAREYIRQHGAQVDRDLHEMRVRARAEEMVRGS